MELSIFILFLQAHYATADLDEGPIIQQVSPTRYYQRIYSTVQAQSALIFYFFFSP